MLVHRPERLEFVNVPRGTVRARLRGETRPRLRVTAYATTLAFFPAAHAVAESDESMQALIAGAVAATGAPAAFLLPVRQAQLFRWCLDAGLRVVKPMTYMTVGEYHEPRGSWIPSVLY